MMDLKNFHPETEVFTPIQTPEKVDVSVVIPVFNEDESIPELHNRLSPALLSTGKNYEIIFIDDGSTDGTSDILNSIQFQDSRVWIIQLRRNFGQAAAFSAGFDLAHGDVIVTLDGDLQNDPADIPMMIQKIEEGYDVVSGWRINRQDTFITRTLPSRMANWLISTVTGVHLHDYGCTLKAYRREVITGFRLYGEMHRFIPAYADSVGANMIEVPVNHHARRYGKTKYGLNRTFKVILDLFTVKFMLSYAKKPIYLFGGTGIVLIIVSLATLLFLMLRKLIYTTSVFDSPLFQMSTMFIILGFQSILMGLIAELLVRTYHESQQKPTYTVRKVINEENRNGTTLVSQISEISTKLPE